ncbi:MAG: uracil-DNA glycosylase family protein [Phycisphaeraceae bacterium]
MPSPDPTRILRQHLETDALLGVTAVPTPTPIHPNNKPMASAQADAVGSRPAPPRQQTQAPSRPAPSNFALKQPPARDTAPPLPPVRPGDVKLLTGLSTAEKIERLQQLADQFEQDPKVQALRPPSTNLVFGEGSPDAKLMFIGEGPGEQEDKTGRPFVGPAGELLDKMITAMGLSRAPVYIAHVVKYRAPSNRIPNPEEVAAQGPTLAQQVAIINPTVIVALGGAAAKYALNNNTGITRLRGQWAQFVHTDPTIPVMPTFHPAYLLRSYTPDNRKKVWADLQAALTKI